MSNRAFFLTIIMIFAVPSAALAEGYLYNKDATVIGTVGTYTITDKSESLIELARKFDLGYNAIVDANPALDPFLPGAGESVLIPTSWILPDIKVYNGIVINLSELRLYFFSGKGSQTHITTFPIGIGSQGTETPVGSFRVMEKIVKPAWHVPASIRKEHPELPLVVPPGPNNPMGSHALRLSLPSVLIHGTDRPFAVGRKASHGCLRLYPEDIPKLFRMVSIGTRVTIVRQPVKIGIKEGKVYIEVHKDETIKEDDYHKMAVALLAKKHLLGQISSIKLFHALFNKSGFAVEISTDKNQEETPIEVALEGEPL